MKIGQRAKVKITDRRRWATGWSELIDGKEGEVEEVKPVNSIGCGGVLVRLDEAVQRARRGAQPLTHIWLHPDDVAGA